MKILYLCQRIPYPPDRGDRIPVFHHIKHLRKNHEVVVGSMAHPGTRKNAEMLQNALGVKVIAPDHFKTRQAKETVSAFLQRKPLSVGYFRNPDLEFQIDRESAEKHFDAIIVFSSSMAPYVERYRNIPKIMHFCDVDSQKWESMYQNSHGLRRWIYRRESRILLEYERKIAAAFESSCVVSQNEADLFRKHIPGIPVHVIENGVDIEYFAAVPRLPEGLRIIFVGVMDYAPNIDAVTFFADRVWREIRELHPQARFIIVGSKPTSKVCRLSQIQGVEVTGYVPDIRTYLSSATFSIAPLAIARGVQNKILESMAAGTPVLTTPAVAKGLPDGAQTHVFVAEREPEPFADKVLELLNQEKEREEKARGAQSYIRQNCTWEAKLRTLDSLLSQLPQKD